MRTVASYIASMRHALGKLPAPGHDLYTSFNAAGAAVFSEGQFDWMLEEATLPVVSGQDYLDLPKDFGSLDQCWTLNTGTFPCVEVVDRAAIFRMRAASTTTITYGTLYLCFSAATNTPGTPTQPRALVFPTPQASGSPTVNLSYWRGWRQVGVADNDKGVQIPEDWEHALDLKARAVAFLIENQTAAIEEAAYQAEIKRLRDKDAVRQPSEGKVRGGVNSRMGNRVPVTTWGVADFT